MRKIIGGPEDIKTFELATDKDGSIFLTLEGEKTVVISPVFIVRSEGEGWVFFRGRISENGHGGLFNPSLKEGALYDGLYGPPP